MTSPAPLGLNLDRLPPPQALPGAFASPLFILLLFFVLHLVVGAVMPYRRGFRPPLAAFMEAAARLLAGKLNRPYLYRLPGGRNRLAARGFALVIILFILSVLAGFGVNALKKYNVDGLGELLLLALTVSVMGPLKVLRETGKQLEKNNTLAAVAALFPYVRADLSLADAFAIARRALEFGAVAFNRYFLGPVLVFVLFRHAGLGFLAAALTFYAGATTPPGGQGPFWRGLRLMGTVLNYVPSHAGAVLLSLASTFVSKSSPWRALVTMAAQGRSYQPAEEGCLVAAVAGGIGVTLGGPTPLRDPETPERIDGDTPQTNFRWVGPAGTSAKISINDLQRGAMVIFAGYLCTMVLVSCIFMASFYLP